MGKEIIHRRHRRTVCLNLWGLHDFNEFSILVKTTYKQTSCLANHIEILLKLSVLLRNINIYSYYTLGITVLNILRISKKV